MRSTFHAYSVPSDRITQGKSQYLLIEEELAEESDDVMGN